MSAGRPEGRCAGAAESMSMRSGKIVGSGTERLASDVRASPLGVEVLRNAGSLR